MHMHLRERRSHVRTFEMVETGNLRLRMERAIESLIAALDALDDDVDLEPDNDDEPGSDQEPWLGAIERHPSGDRGWSPFLRRDDDGSQTAWAAGGSDDREFDDADDEDGGDLEACCEDEGAQCDDELDEGVPLAFAAPCSVTTRPALDPSLMPDLYFIKGEGNCWSPVIKDGDRVLISKVEPVQPGDFAAIYLDPRFVPRGEHQVLLKRLVSDGRGNGSAAANGQACVVVETLNPPRKFAIPAAAVLAIHRLVRVDNETPAPHLSAAAFLASRSTTPIASVRVEGSAR